MAENFEEKPSLVSAGQGFSVSYKGKFLYSRYNPERAIKAAVENLSVLPGTLVFLFSPALWYGVDDLIAKLPEQCPIIAVENELNLFAFCAEKIAELPVEVHLLNTAEAKKYAAALIRTGKIKRAIRVDLSAGVQFFREEYAAFFAEIQDAISVFWKNRITLVRFGRIFSHNVMKSLGRFSEAIPFGALEKSVSSPIFVFGAGESTELLLKKIPKSLLEKCVIIAVDAAVLPLKAHGIFADAVVTVEAQSAIDACFAGAGVEKSVLIADLCSRTIRRKVGAKSVAAFLSKYDDATYLARLKRLSILPTEIEPLGSVGLTAVQIALLLRSQPEIPIFVAGLDFSYTAGATHTKEAPQHKKRLRSITRLFGVDNMDAAFGVGAEKCVGKDGNRAITTKNLSGYADLFARYFAGTPFLFDAGESGLPLSIPCVSSAELGAFLSRVQSKAHFLPNVKKNHDLSQKIRDFYCAEEKALTHLKELLIFGEKALAEDEKQRGLSAAILSLLSERDYLYLHFPDGFSPSVEPQFLKRVRAEIDSFLKDIQLGLSFLCETES